MALLGAAAIESQLRLGEDIIARITRWTYAPCRVGLHFRPEFLQPRAGASSLQFWERHSAAAPLLHHSAALRCAADSGSLMSYAIGINLFTTQQETNLFQLSLVVLVVNLVAFCKSVAGWQR